MLEMAVLGLLKEQDMHGYELKKRISDVFGLSSAVSFGSLYPALARLEKAGAVHVVAPDKSQAGPGTGLPISERRPSRRRKVYGITSLGANLFEELLAGSQDGGDDERSFNLRLAFARYLPPEGRLGLLEQRRAVLGERLARAAARARARRDDRYMRILSERQEDDLSRDVSWLDRLIQEERASRPNGEANPSASPNDEGRAPGQADRASEATGSSSGDRPSEGEIVRPQPPREAVRLVPLASASQLQRAAQASGAPYLAPRPSETTTPEPVKDGI